MILHADKLGPAILFCGKLQLGELCGPHTARSDISNLATLD
jgi:hypothetical protein